ncbi:6-phosphogluconolactonase [Caballeronia udeis]|uniref:6-phosphogluconolactonase n=1 Tax=Caballeronia udeis TaxID=1232866 RepID=A0A158GP15_9BURK|nr:lactonase family protein [Caballeronia udeis]SAL33782.1 6-phosphogluconolactonase [Caballeronia udeis]
MPTTTLVFIGCINRAVPHFASANGRGIATFRLDDTTGKLTPLAETADVINPSYLAILTRRRLLFATSEVFGWPEGRVSAYRIDAATGALTLLNRQATRGSLSAHCNTDRDGRCVLVANYGHEVGNETPGQHVASFAILDNGMISPALSTFSHLGSGPDQARQSVPHGHCLVPSPDNRFAVVTDLGTDEVVTYRLDAPSGRLMRVDGSPARLPPGSGPRHFVFHPDGVMAYVVNELNATIGRFTYSVAEGALRLLDVVRALPEDAVPSHSAALQIAADGRVLYASFRGDDSIACYPLDPVDGSVLSPTVRSSGGKTPRSFALSPSGKFLLVANQDSDLVVTFRIDPLTGQLGEQVDAVPVGTPMCVQAVNLDS